MRRLAELSVTADPLYDNPSDADIDNNIGDDHVSLTAYDEEGNISKEIDRNGRRIEFDYDFAGRLLTEQWYAADSNSCLTKNQCPPVLG